LSAEVEASPPPPAPPPPAPPALAAAGEEGVDLRRRSATPFTMFIAPDRTQLAAAAAPAAHHRRACVLAGKTTIPRIRPRSPGSDRSGDEIA
jgi:hypothetical protein